jgi:signal transduction histidine kinase
VASDFPRPAVHILARHGRIVTLNGSRQSDGCAGRNRDLTACGRTDGGGWLHRQRYASRCVGHALLWLTILSFPFSRGLCAVPSEPTVFRTASSILSLTGEEAARSKPVLLHGVVTSSTDYGMWLQDKTAGIWAERSDSQDFAAGDEVEVKGHTGPGLFSPVVVPEAIRKLGRSRLPVPKEVSLKELLTGNEDAQYVRITGLIRSVGIRPNVSPAQRIWVKVAMEDRFIFATLPKDDGPAANKLIGAVVQIDAPASCTKNLRRQITSVVLAVPGLQNVTVIRRPPEDLFAVPAIPIARLMQYRSVNDMEHRIQVSGTVTYIRPGERLTLEENGRAVLVMTEQRSNIKPGDRVDAVGFPILAPSGPLLEDAIFRYAGPGDLPTPTAVTITDLSSGTLNYNLISIEGTLLQRINEPYGQVLLLKNNSTLFRADLDDLHHVDNLKHVREGSIVKISGINVLDIEGSWNQGGPDASAIHYTILLRSPADVVQIRPPSWWTATHLLYLAAVLALLVFVFFVLALYAKMEHWRLEAVLHERERLAHEIHDTLAQSFAGIGFQMQAIRRAIPQELPELRKQVDLARALVRHSHKEARRSIEPIQVATLEHVHLLSAIESSARRMVEGGSVAIFTTSTGDPQTLPLETVDALLHIGQEAVANAVRHAEPSQLTIGLAYETGWVRLSIKDDGRGFEETGDLLGFGLRGMRKRAAAISARLEITSNPETGTCVQVVCPLQSKGRVAAFLNRFYRFVSEGVSNGRRKQQPDPDSNCR